MEEEEGKEKGREVEAPRESCFRGFPRTLTFLSLLVLPSPLPLISLVHCMDTRLKYVQLEGAIYLHTVSGLSASSVLLFHSNASRSKALSHFPDLF